VRQCLLLSCLDDRSSVVLDIFCDTGTTALVALQMGFRAISIAATVRERGGRFCSVAKLAGLARFASPRSTVGCSGKGSPASGAAKMLAALASSALRPTVMRSRKRTGIRCKCARRLVPLGLAHFDRVVGDASPIIVDAVGELC
jgi:hypothetical protein